MVRVVEKVIAKGVTINDSNTSYETIVNTHGADKLWLYITSDGDDVGVFVTAMSPLHEEMDTIFPPSTTVIPATRGGILTLLINDPPPRLKISIQQQGAGTSGNVNISASFIYNE